MRFPCSLRSALTRCHRASLAAWLATLVAACATDPPPDATVGADVPFDTREGGADGSLDAAPDARTPGPDVMDAALVGDTVPDRDVLRIDAPDAAPPDAGTSARVMVGIAPSWNDATMRAPGDAIPPLADRAWRALQYREAAMGRPFALVRTYHGYSDTSPLPVEIAALEGHADPSHPLPVAHRRLVTSWNLKLPGATTYVASWADFAASSGACAPASAGGPSPCDVALQQLATSLAALGDTAREHPVNYFAFHHEPFGEIGTAPTGWTPADFQAAFRHAVAVVRAAAPGRFRFIFIDVSYSYGPRAAELARMYPGNDAVDYLGTDGYNGGAGCGSPWRTFEDATQNALSWNPGWTTVAEHRPVMVTETGCAPDRDGNSKIAWWHDAATVLQTVPAFRANMIGVMQWDSAFSDGCDIRIDGPPSAAVGWDDFANDPWNGRESDDATAPR